MAGMNIRRQISLNGGAAGALMHHRLGASVAFLLGLVLSLGGLLGASDPRSGIVIPIDSVYATFGQENVKPISVESADVVDTMTEVREGPAQVVLCAGSDITVAAKTSVASFARIGDPNPCMVGGSNTRLWVAAYLGSEGSVPPAFQVRAIEVAGKHIRVVYERDESPARSCDLLDYVIWAPLGRSEPGCYTLELFDFAAQTVVATRSWCVTSN